MMMMMMMMDSGTRSRLSVLPTPTSNSVRWRKPEVKEKILLLFIATPKQERKSWSDWFGGRWERGLVFDSPWWTVYLAVGIIWWKWRLESETHVLFVEQCWYQHQHVCMAFELAMLVYMFRFIFFFLKGIYAHLLLQVELRGYHAVAGNPFFFSSPLLSWFLPRQKQSN